MKKYISNDFADKIIDIHSHAGVAIDNYFKMEWPYAESIESLYFKQLVSGVDCNVIFPVGPELHADFYELVENDNYHSAKNPISSFPFKTEHQIIFKELESFYETEENCKRFLPFLSFDPGRKVTEQLKSIKQLCESRVCYGIKINATTCRINVSNLNNIPDFFDIVHEFDLPVIFHSTCDESEGYSWARKILDIQKKFNFRCCLAHGICFHKAFLDEAAARQNVWVDTAALKIMLQFVQENYLSSGCNSDFLNLDYNNPAKALYELARIYPDTIIWGTDSPFYSYISTRKLKDGSTVEFNYKSSIFDEVKALNYLPQEYKKRIANTNSLKFIFG